MHRAKRHDSFAVIELDEGVFFGDRDALDSLELLCSDLVRGGRRCILLDLNEVRSAPSVFLATLASLQNRVRALGGEIAAIRATSQMRKLFRVTVMDQVVGLYGDEQTALEAVGRYLEKMRRELDRDLTSSRKLTRIKAALKLARMGKDKGLSLLTGYLEDEEPVMRLHATISLAALGGTRVVEPLIQALSDPDSRVRTYAAEALGSMADARAVEPLKAAVRFERNRNVVFKAKQALKQLLQLERPLSIS